MGLSHTIKDDNYRRSATKIVEAYRIAFDKCKVLDRATRDYCITKVNPNIEDRKRVSRIFKEQKLKQSSRYNDQILTIVSGKLIKSRVRLSSRLYLDDSAHRARAINECGFKEVLEHIKENRDQVRVINPFAKEYELISRVIPLNHNVYDIFYDQFLSNVSENEIKKNFKKFHYRCSVRHMADGTPMDPSFQKIDTKNYKHAYVFYLFLEILNREIDVLYGGKTMNLLFNQKNVNEVIEFLKLSEEAEDELYCYRTFVMETARSKMDTGNFIVAK